MDPKGIRCSLLEAVHLKQGAGSHASSARTSSMCSIRRTHATSGERVKVSASDVHAFQRAKTCDIAVSIRGGD